MSPAKKNIKYIQIVVMLLALAGIVLIKTVFTEKVIRTDCRLLTEAESLTQKWFGIVADQKAKLGIKSDSHSPVRNSAVLGDDYTKITTTLGSLEAKELTTNPAYSAVILKMLLKEGIDSTSTLGITISGSFPGLAIAALAAAQTINAKVILFSSLGASSYGANQPGALWSDIEKWLRDYGGMKYQTSLLTLGADNDRGEGMLENADSIFSSAIDRSGLVLYLPNTLEESINYKTKVLLDNKVDLYINIGGNHAAIGNCPHAVTLPNGLNQPKRICLDDERGIVIRLAERGIPFIHLLNIKDLSLKNGIPLGPGVTYGDSSSIFYVKKVNIIAVIVIAVLLLLSLFYYKVKILS